MTTKTNDSSSQPLSQGENAGIAPPQSGPPEHQTSRNRNQVFKSGPLYLSSKGIGWTSWKKRWFILTRTSLVFFRSDPSAAPQKGNEMNLTLGGIDLNNSASVEVKVDKKLLTVFFPDGRDGRAFTLKAETLEDLHEWKTALENALAQAPSATHATGQNGILKSEQVDGANGSADQQKDRPPIKSMVIGRPILLALEDIDGSPSFLEKALKFIEDYGVKVEGILRQAADVEEVHRRVREYEQGKTEFSPEEDPHVIGDCVKYILRELPSSPVPASCCTALLEAFRSDRNNRLNAMRTAILETFPEPNRQLLQRILMMMQSVASHKLENRMSVSAVAACMSPLLLRPLLAGDCELENTHMDVAGDGSLQLLQAAAAANHAQAIIITLLEEYDNIFGEGSMSPELFSDSDESGSGTATDDDDMYDDDDEEEEEEEGSDDEEASDDHDAETDDDYEHSVTETCSDSGDHEESDSNDDKQSERSSSFSKSPERVDDHLAKRSPSASPRTSAPQNNNVKGSDNTMKQVKDTPISVTEIADSTKSHRDIPAETSSVNETVSFSSELGSQLSTTKFLGCSQARRPRWGRTSAKKNLSMESIDFSVEDDEDEIERLEAAKIELQNRIAEEANGNAKLQASLERRKKALHERRLALENDVARLQEQLQKERELRAALESGISTSQVPGAAGVDEKIKAELEEIALAEENFNSLKHRLDDLGAELIRQHERNRALMLDRSTRLQETSSQGTMPLNNKDKETKDNLYQVERSSRIEGQRNYDMDGADRDNDWKNETSSLSNKSQNQTNDTARAGSSKFAWLQSNSSSSPSQEASVPKPTSSASRKSGKSETTSALSKLTTRLNFLKERRNQIANELQNIDKGRGSPILSPGKGKAPEPLHIVHNIDKTQGPEGNFVQNKEDLSHQLSHSSSKGTSTGFDNEDGNRRGDNKDGNSKGDNKDVNRKGDNKDGNRKGDNKDGNKKGDNKDGNRKGDNKDGKHKGDNKDVKQKGDNKDGKQKGDNKDDNRKGDNKDDNKKGSSSKPDIPSAQNLDRGRKPENQSNQHLDRIKSEGQSSSKNTDRGRKQDGQYSNTSRTLSR